MLKSPIRGGGGGGGEGAELAAYRLYYSVHIRFVSFAFFSLVYFSEQLI